MDMDLRNNDGDDQSDDPNGDGEGVWSPDIEQCFREALLLFPPCGRRKHILQEEGGGKMYGRNELIARHIMMRTGKRRTRKQVSSHIQVLARRKAKAEVADSTNSAGPTPSPSVITTTTTTNNRSHLQQQSIGGHQNQFSSSTSATLSACVGGSLNMVGGLNVVSAPLNNMLSEQAAIQQQHNATYFDVWLDRPIVTQKIRLVEFSAFIEYRRHHFQPQQQLQNQYQQPLPSSSLNSSACTSGFTRHSYIQIDYSQQINRQLMTTNNKLERIDISQIQDKFPEISGSEGLFQRGPSDAFYLIKFWADLNNDYEYNINDQNSYFGFSSHFETINPYKEITCSTKACSYGLQVVEKVEKIYGCLNNLNGRYSYNINRSPMCEFMIQFIRKLRQLPRASQMNSVLENFTVLQVITSESTSEILLCLAYIFEVATPPLNTTATSATGLVDNNQHQGPQYHVYKLAKD